MAWTLLILAGGFEVVWALALKRAEGFTRPWPSVLTLVAMLLSIVLLAQALKHLPVGTAYAVWTGVGAAGAAIFGILFFGESASPAKLLSVALIVTGVVGLRLFGVGDAPP
jgi:quaternary ammonium compound-resistance protein SugE